MTLVARLGAWALAFACTQLVEVPIYRHALGGRLLVAFGASAITHPIVWFVFPWLLANERYWAMVAAAELFAVLVEAAWLFAFGLRRALLWSLVANGASFAVGLVSRAAFGFP